MSKQLKEASENLAVQTKRQAEALRKFAEVMKEAVVRLEKIKGDKQ